MNTEDLRLLAFYALFGLQMEIIDPLSKRTFDDAKRIILNVNSKELRQLAELMDIEPHVLQKDIIETLSIVGFEFDKGSVKH